MLNKNWNLNAGQILQKLETFFGVIRQKNSSTSIDIAAREVDLFLIHMYTSRFSSSSKHKV